VFAGALGLEGSIMRKYGQYAAAVAGALLVLAIFLWGDE
jgi:hypothetical protein